MAKAILAGKHIKELTAKQALTLFAALYTELAQLSEDFFVRNRPGNAGNRYGQ